MKPFIPIAMHARGPRTSAALQRGVGLIEVMMAVLILSIGFLGIGALLATSLSTNNGAMARSMATVGSYSILDAMRADHANATAGNYNTTVVANACPAASTTLASNQLHEWCTQLGQNLGKKASTTGEVSCTKVTDDATQCIITISFDDSRSGGSDSKEIVTRAIL